MYIVKINQILLYLLTGGGGVPWHYARQWVGALIFVTRQFSTVNQTAYLAVETKNCSVKAQSFGRNFHLRFELAGPKGEAVR